jgi:hypothetical protein
MHLDDSVALLGYVGIITLCSFPLAYALTLFVLARDDTGLQGRSSRSAAQRSTPHQLKDLGPFIRGIVDLHWVFSQ